MACLNCGEKLTQTPGKREKQFCDSTCRSNYWQKKNRLDKKGFSPPVVVKDLNKPINQVKPKEHPKTNFTLNTKNKNIPPEPVMKKGEDRIEFAMRKNEWKKKYNQ